MKRPRRYVFPGAYVGLLLPVMLHSDPRAKFLVILAAVLLAFLADRKIASRVAALLSLALGSLTVLLALVQGSVCWRESTGLTALSYCVGVSGGGTVLNAAVLGSALMLGVTNEWRGSLVTTLNGLWIPRSVRLVGIVAGAMIGEFQRAAFRVHQAFTGRGEALPGVNWRNAIALPAIMAATWTAVLSGAAARLDLQWGAEPFWARYVPVGRGRLPRISDRDLVVMSGCALAAAIALLSGQIS